MDVLIITKWTTDWTGKENLAPSIISQVINNMLKGGEVVGAALIGDKAYQESLARWLLLAVIVCVPTMLFTKPYFLYRQANSKNKKQSSSKK